MVEFLRRISQVEANLTPFDEVAAELQGHALTWKIFTRGIRGEEAMRRAQLKGDRALGLTLLGTVSVVA